ncbi:ATP-grasp domain-containing protein [Psychromonas sp. MME2]|uniref:ATP-grasp domain-containing protein n=1 Tax=unclassified Psychromonas TaxID=2614957 RepID=UPI00339C3304
MSNWIILIGGRSAALEAALALNLKVLLIAEPTTPKRVLAKADQHLAISLRAPFQEILSNTLPLLADNHPLAIIAATEQGVLPAAQLREYFSIDGQDVNSARDALIKSKMKKRFKHAGLPCWPTVEVKSVEQALHIAQQYTYPLVVKALASSGSRGFRIIKDRATLRRVVTTMLERADYGGVGIEPFCDLKECSVELILHNGNIIFSNVTNYLIASKLNFLPAKFPQALSDKLLTLCHDVATTFNFKQGMLHIEFYYSDSELWLGEVNARPPGGGLMELIELAYDFNPWDLFIRSYLKEPLQRITQTKKYYAANWVIHPGKGIVKNISGIDDIVNHPLTKHFSLKLKEGQTVYRREGTGSSVGNLTMCSKDHNKLTRAILTSTQILQIEMEKEQKI